MSFRIIAVAFFLTVACSDLYAADTVKVATPAIAVIDVQKILQESLAAKSVQQQIDAQRSKFQSETEKEENGLRLTEQDLGKTREQIAADTYAEHEQQLRQSTLTVERHFEARRKMLDQAFADAKNVMSSALQDVVQSVAHEHGLNLVLIKQQVFWSESAFDITAEVLDRLNKRLPQIQVKMREEAKE